MKLAKVLLALLIFLPFIGIGQHEDDQHEENKLDTHHLQHHRIAIVAGYGFINGAIDENGKESTKVIPVFAVDYDYWFNHKWAIGLHSDIELSSYSIAEDHQEYLERNYAFLISVVGTYEILPGWAVFAGPGYEFETHQNFAVLRVGTDIAKTFENGWGAAIVIGYDIKEVNSMLNLGLAISKRFGK